MCRYPKSGIRIKPLCRDSYQNKSYVHKYAVKEGSIERNVHKLGTK